MRNPERYKGLFIFIFTTIVMAIIGLWIAWVRDTGRWHLFAIYCAGLAVIIVKYWDYRD